MKQSELTRRAFLQKSALGASALAMGVGSRARAGEEEKEVALGVIGVGGRGSHLLRKAARIEGVRIVAVCDLLTNKVADGQDIAKKANPKNDPKGYTRFQEMLEKEKLDGVIVATEVGNHAKCAAPVLDAGFNCFCEKPMDTTVERVDAIVKAARKAKGFLQVGFQRHYNVGYVKAIERIHKGDLGKVSFLQGHWHWPWNIGGGWVSDMDLGGGELVEQAGHHMDVMAWVMKYEHPIECTAMANISRNISPDSKPISEDHSAVLFRFPGNVVFSYTHIFYAPQVWQDELMWAYGQNWGVDLVKSELYQGDKAVVPLGEGSGTDWDKGTDTELEAFVEKIRKGDKEKPLSNVETARIATLMCLMGREAFRDVKSNTFRTKIVTWKDLGTTTDL